MHLSAEQIEHYRIHGHVAGPRVLSDEQIDRLRKSIADILEDRVNFPAHLKGETVEKSKAKGQLPSVKVVNLLRHHPVFAELLKNTNIGSVAHDLMQGPVRMWEDQMIFKPPFDEESNLSWHQDYTFWDHVGPPELGTCWIALDDATVANGCMHVIPGSHKWNMRYNRDDADVNDVHWIMKQAGIPQGADLTPVPCELKAGECHFHHCRLFHGSYGNKTSNPRRSYIMHLMPGNTRRLGDDWNDRMASVEHVAVGEIVQGSAYPELAVAN